MSSATTRRGRNNAEETMKNENTSATLSSKTKFGLAALSLGLGALCFTAALTGFRIGQLAALPTPVTVEQVTISDFSVMAPATLASLPRPQPKPASALAELLEAEAVALAALELKSQEMPAETQTQKVAFRSKSDAELECLAKAIYFEARSEPLSGQLAVAEVVMNRVDHRYYPNSICGVVYENSHWFMRCQFTFTCDGIPDRPTEAKVWDRSQSLARYFLEERDLGITNAATHYHADYVDPHWADHLVKTVKIGRHIFYRPKPHVRGRG